MAARRRDRSRCRRLLLQLLVYLSMVSIPCATDTLLQGDSIRDGQTLVSPGEVFVLGFFSPSPMSKYRYVGIWYKNTEDRVWVANRERPLTDNSGVLTIDSSGSLMILDGRSTDRVVQVLAPGSGANTSRMAILLDSGNLLFLSVSLYNITGLRVLWQSFDYPTDTWLPGMRLGKRKGGLNWQLTSWRSPSDPSPGDLVFGAGPDGPRLFLSRRGTVSWSSGVWSGRFFQNEVSDLPYFFASVGNLSYHSNESETGDAYFEYSSTAEQTRLVMEAGGQVKMLMWDSQYGKWVVLWATPVRDQCEIPGYCGDAGLCASAGTPACKCLDGFEPYVPARWASGDWSGGCLPLSPLSYGDGDGFLRLDRVKLPPVLRSNYAGVDSNPIEGSCRNRCLANCRCAAYALAYQSRRGCFMWLDRLFGLQQPAENDSWSEIYVGLAASEGRRNRLFMAAGAVFSAIVLCGVLFSCYFLWAKGREGSRKKLFMGAGAVFSAIVQCGVFPCYFLWAKGRGVKEDADEALLLRDIGMDGPVTYKFVSVGDRGGERGPDINLYNFSNILTATNNFSEDNKLGEGGFGPVYKGKLPDGQETAIKRLSTRSSQGLEEFKTEILVIARLQHKNLVRLLGCCIQREERLLIYEYMPNKSLDFFLFDPNRAAQLDWGRRVQIIEGITQGLLYLHKYSRLTIIHRDLKVSNILLDEEMNPKISDFGMARIFSSSETQANTNRIVGTFGYMPPEYAMEGLFSVKSDVFSFGVLLLEIVSGKKNIGSHHHLPGHRSLLGYAWELWKAGRELELMDPALGESCPQEEVSRCIFAGLMCVQEHAIDRPTMAEVVAMLAGGSSAHRAPKPPAFFTENRTARDGFSAEFVAANCANDVTISVIEGR